MNFNTDKLKRRFISLLDSKEQFIVDFDEAWVWLEFSRKDSAKRVLTANFEQEVDYVVLLNSVELDNHGAFSPQEKAAATKKEVINLTVDCFKSLCMLSNTTQGKLVRKYYLEIEKEWKASKEQTSKTISMAEYLLEQAKLMVELEQRQLAIEAEQKRLAEAQLETETKVARIVKNQEDADRLLNEFAKSGEFESAPPTSMQGKTNWVVRAYCHKNSKSHQDVFNYLYREFKYRYHIDLKARCYNAKVSGRFGKSKSTLDYTFAFDHGENFYTLVVDCLINGAYIV